MMKMLHVTIQTEKFQEELQFFQAYAGLTIRTDMRPMGRNMVFLSDGEGETEIEIIENPDAADAGSAYLSVGFQTEDAIRKREEMTAAGFAATPMMTPGPNVRFFFVTDPAGVRIQFLEKLG